MSKNLIKGSQSDLAAEAIRMLHLKDQSSIVALLWYVDQGYISAGRAADEIITKHTESLMLENQKQGEIIKILLHQVSNLTALLRVELGEERAVSRYPRECKRGDKV